MKEKISNALLIEIGGKIVWFNPLTVLLFIIIFIIYIIGGLLELIKDFFTNILADVDWYQTGFTKTKLYKKVYWVYDVLALIIVYIVFHRWNKLEDRHFELIDKYLKKDKIKMRLIKYLKKINNDLPRHNQSH